MTTKSIITTDVHTNQDWASKPDLVYLALPDDILEKIPACLQTMKAVGIKSMDFADVLNYEFYEEADEDSMHQTITHEGVKYTVMEAEFAVTGCDLRVFSDGSLRGVCPFDHTSDELWFDLGSYDEITSQNDASAGSSVETIRVAVLCRNSAGEAEFFNISVTCTTDEIADGKHYDQASSAASDYNFEPIAAFDEGDRAARQMAEIAQWFAQQ